ncbi:META domain-containing protein [Mesorhizobium sp. LHD-90]|uniref:META domain-containing protein n=1 Tax=Mesorhizobium sp. LHD-90 TaxID=3071414 RepID=UPI0027DFC9DA|nr:META domain-containing protein [Mesorhizobium sp. LHD-90]MDQ6438331.1 META domain-containing protein [Mesorhizobium sp. LHD-90]
MIRRNGVRAALAAVMLCLTGGFAMADAPPEGPYGKWSVAEIGGQGVVAKADVTLEIGADGKAFGSGGCNRFRTSVKVADGAISFMPAAATRMMCEPEISGQEMKFFGALDAVRGWKWDGPALILLDADEKIVLRLRNAS